MYSFIHYSCVQDRKDEVFKMGRSTGKLFKEKGVSLYKDKEISTTHAKVELRNGEAFFIDAKSTNGSHLNGYVLLFYSYHNFI